MLRREKACTERLVELRRYTAQVLDAEEELRELRTLELQSQARRALTELRLIAEELPMLAHWEELRTDGAPPAADERSAGPGLQVTEVVLGAGGELLMREQTIQAVFVPRMSEPTMSLEEFAEQEMRDAAEREKSAAAGDGGVVRRYKQLLEAGLEDEADLLEQATLKDREWDNWREENPRGSGNKMGKRF